MQSIQHRWRTHTPAQWSSCGSRGNPSSGGRFSSTPRCHPGCALGRWWRKARTSCRGRCRRLQPPTTPGDTHQLFPPPAAPVHKPAERRRDRGTKDGWMAGQGRKKNRKKQKKKRAGQNGQAMEWKGDSVAGGGREKEWQQKNSEGDGRNKEKWNKMRWWLMLVIVTNGSKRWKMRWKCTQRANRELECRKSDWVRVCVPVSEMKACRCIESSWQELDRSSSD